MTANTSPIFSLTPITTFVPVQTTGTNNYDGTSGGVLACTAGANGTYVKSIYAKALGTNIASCVRIFFNNGSTTGTAANNSLFLEYSLPATTASATSATQNIEIPIYSALAASYKVYVCLTTTVAAGWVFTCNSGDY